SRKKRVGFKSNSSKSARSTPPSTAAKWLINRPTYRHVFACSALNALPAFFSLSVRRGVFFPAFLPVFFFSLSLFFILTSPSLVHPATAMPVRLGVSMAAFDKLFWNADGNKYLF